MNSVIERISSFSKMIVTTIVLVMSSVCLAAPPAPILTFSEKPGTTTGFIKFNFKCTGAYSFKVYRAIAPATSTPQTNPNEWTIINDPFSDVLFCDIADIQTMTIMDRDVDGATEYTYIVAPHKNGQDLIYSQPLNFYANALPYPMSLDINLTVDLNSIGNKDFSFVGPLFELKDPNIEAGQFDYIKASFTLYERHPTSLQSNVSIGFVDFSLAHQGKVSSSSGDSIPLSLEDIGKYYSTYNPSQQVLQTLQKTPGGVVTDTFVFYLFDKNAPPSNDYNDPFYVKSEIRFHLKAKCGAFIEFEGGEATPTTVQIDFDGSQMCEDDSVVFTGGVYKKVDGVDRFVSAFYPSLDESGKLVGQYEINLPESEKPGDYEVLLTATVENKSVTTQARLPFSIACPPPISEINDFTVDADVNHYEIPAVFGSPSKCSGLMQVIFRIESEEGEILTEHSMAQGPYSEVGEFEWEYARPDPLQEGRYRLMQKIESQGSGIVSDEAWLNVICSPTQLIPAGIDPFTPASRLKGMVVVPFCAGPDVPRFSVSVDGQPEQEVALELANTQGRARYYSYTLPTPSDAAAVHLDVKAVDGKNRLAEGAWTVAIARDTTQTVLVRDKLEVSGLTAETNSLGRMGYRSGTNGAKAMTLHNAYGVQQPNWLVHLYGVAGRNPSGDFEYKTSMTATPENRVLFIGGYTYHPESVSASGGYVLVKKDGGDVYQIPFITRAFGGDAALAYHETEELVWDAIWWERARLTPQEIAAAANAGFVAAVDTWGAPEGTYTVFAVNMAGEQANIDDGPTFVVQHATADIELDLRNVNNEPVAAVGKIDSATGTVLISEYPPSRSGEYHLYVKTVSLWGIESAEAQRFTINYTRPTLSAMFNNPNVSSFPGEKKEVTLTNPLTREPLEGDIIGYASFNKEGTSGVLNGVEVGGSDSEVSLTPGSYGYTKLAASSTNDEAVMHVFLSKPDAPDLKLSFKNWDPDEGIEMATDKPVYAPLLDRVTVQLKKSSTSGCPSIVGLDPVMMDSSYGYESPVCGIRWVLVPQGITQPNPRTPGLQGYLNSPNDLTMTYETGVVWRDPDTKKAVFYPAKEHSLTAAVTDPEGINITFQPAEALRLATQSAPAGQYYTYPGDFIAGQLTAQGKYSGIHLGFSTGGSQKERNSSSTYATEAVITQLGSIGDEQTVEVEAYYTKAPDWKFTKTLNFKVLPRDPVITLRNQLAVSTEDVLLEGFFGTFLGGSRGYSYDKQMNGLWNLNVYELDVRDNLTKVGSTIDTANVADDGAFTLPLGRVAPGVHRMIAEATLKNIEGKTIRSNRVSFQIQNGEPIEARIVPRPETGALPFQPLLTLILNDSKRFADIDVVRWQKAVGEGVFSDAVDANDSPLQGTAIRPTLKESGPVVFQAIIKNRHSGQETPTEPVTIQGFNVVKLAIEGAQATVVGFPVTLTGKTTNGVQANFTWKVQKGGSDKNPLIVTGDTLEINPDVVGNLIITLQGEEVGAPQSNPGRVATTSAILRVVAPQLQRPYISGPKMVETGKTYTFSVVQPPLFNAGTVVPFSLAGKWLLPDGTEVAGNTVDYEVKPGDKYMRYETRIVEMPEVKIQAEYQLLPWTYAWPEWVMKTQILDARAPAQIRFSVAAKNPADIAKMNGEKAGYDWSYPPGMTMLDQKDNYALVEIAEEGMYQGEVTLSDKRGNETVLTSDIVAVQPPLELNFSTVLTISDRWLRVPSDVGVRVIVSSMPKRDTINQVEYYVDGSLIKSSKTLAETLPVTTPGEHEIKTIVRTTGGKSAQTVQSVSLITGDPPECKLQQSGTPTLAMTIQASCKVAQGFVSRFQWKVNDQPVNVTSTAISFTSADIAKLESVTATAFTDKGQSTTMTWVKL